MNQEKDEKIYTNIKIFLTGYGPWANLTSNPTMDVVKALCGERKKDVETEHTKLVEYEIYEVKVEYVDEHLRMFYEKFNAMKKEENTLYIMVHYGLYSSSKMIQIETRGANYINDFANHKHFIDNNSTNFLYTFVLPFAILVLSQKEVRVFDCSSIWICAAAELSDRLLQHGLLCIQSKKSGSPQGGFRQFGCVQYHDPVGLEACRYCRPA